MCASDGPAHDNRCELKPLIRFPDFVPQLAFSSSFEKQQSDVFTSDLLLINYVTKVVKGIFVKISGLYQAF